MSNEKGEHYCKSAQDVQPNGYCYCLILKSWAPCGGIQEECEVESEIHPKDEA